MKKTIAFIAALVLCIGGLTACGESNEKSESGSSSISKAGNKNDTSKPEPNSTVSTTESNKENISLADGSSEEETSSVSANNSKRYIVNELTPKEFFTALSFYNTDNFTWKNSRNLSLADLEGKTEGLYEFIDEEDGAWVGALSIAMSEGKCIRVRAEIGGISDVQNREEIYDVFKIFLYTVFPDVSTDALDAVKNEIVEWAEAHPVKGDTKPKEFKVGQIPIKAYYDAASVSSKKVYNGFHCIIEFKN